VYNFVISIRIVVLTAMRKRPHAQKYSQRKQKANQSSNVLHSPPKLQ
jgi:hypothetical protein